MALNPGTKLGIYEILSSLGAGGMGEVYRARDTKLNRDVALKVLPEAFAADSQRMGRFEREAQVLASMNHPNIAAIYGLEESGTMRALVMELVEGQTLDEMLGTGRSKIENRKSGVETKTGFDLRVTNAEPLSIAKQVAEALEYAHDHGVIHRDLKPANIKITPEGTVKVLDFGLAKALDTESTASSGVSSSPTLTAVATQAGVIIGTAAYMSPEQARGKAVDRRADIWAFGCVLFEIFSGKRLYGGETISDTLAAVIMKDPEWDALPPTTPVPIQKLIRRCLTKDPRQRLRDIGEARIVIEQTISGVGPIPDLPQAAAVAAPAPLPPEPEHRSPFRRLLPWGVAGLAVILAGLFAAAYLNKSPFASAPVRSLIAAPEDVSFAFDGTFGGPVISPDGTRLVFPGRDDSGKEALYMRPMNSLAAQRLEGTESATFPFWAPDSRHLGFFQGGKLEKMDVTGGPAVALCDVPSGRGGAWSSEDVIVYAPDSIGKQLMRVPAAGGTPTPITTHKGTGSAYSNRWPTFLPDGKHFLYLSGDLTAPGTSKLGIYIGELGSDKEQPLVQADSGPLYAPPGFLLYLRGTTLMAQPFDAGSQKLKGEAFPIGERVDSPSLYRLGFFTVSQTGLLVYQSGGGTNKGRFIWVDSAGKQTGTVGEAGIVDEPRISPDGKRLAYVVYGTAGKTEDIWLTDLERGVRTRFTFGPNLADTPVWSPDGSKIAYGWEQGGHSDLYVKSASGAGTAEKLFASDADKFPLDWSRDGRHILFVALDPKGKTKYDIWSLPMFGDHKPVPFIHTKFDEVDAQFSPDGHWVAFVSDESGNYEVYLSPFPSGGAKWQVSQGGGVQPQWKQDGSTLYYLAPGGKLMEASVQEQGSAIQIGTPQQLFQEQLVRPASAGRSYSVAPDGERFLLDKSDQGAAPPLTLVTNWTSGLKK